MAYVVARDWNEFLLIQEQLLFAVTEMVTRSGTTLALPAQVTYSRGREPGAVDDAASLTGAPLTSGIADRLRHSGAAAADPLVVQAVPSERWGCRMKG